MSCEPFLEAADQIRKAKKERGEFALPDWREEARYGIYEVVAGDEQHLVATCPTLEAIGPCLDQLDRDWRESKPRLPRGRVGVLDGHDGRWIVLPYG